MKIRSITDVITNSSTEVFSMKASDYEDVLQVHPELKVKGIKVYHDVSELVKDYQANPHAGLFDGLSIRDRILLSDFKMLESTRSIIKDFGHTDSEIDDYERAKNLENIKKREESGSLQDFIKKARGIWYNWDRRPENLSELREYLDNCGIEYFWDPG